MFARCASRITGTALLSTTAPLTDSWRHGQTFARIRSSQGQTEREDWAVFERRRCRALAVPVPWQFLFEVPDR